MIYVRFLVFAFFIVYSLEVSALHFSEVDKRTPPNIIFIFIDDMGYADLSSYGNPHISTPNIDRLAKQGTKFTNFYVAAPICSPSRVGVMTGQYPSRHKINSYLAARDYNTKRGMASFLDSKAPFVAREMKKAGYATAHFGKWHMGGGRDVDDAPLPSAYGFDESLVSFEGLGDRLLMDKDHGLSEQSAKLKQGNISWVEKHERTPIYVDRTIKFITEHKDEPFYVNLWTGDVHDPFRPKEKFENAYDHYANNHYQQKFLAVLHELDLEIGRLLASIDELGLAKNTLVIFTSDNGPTDWQHYYNENYAPPGSADPFRGRKWSLYEGGIREPFIVRWPQAIPAGAVDVTTILHATDLFPTLMNICGIEVPLNFDGEDMSKAFLGRPQLRSSPLFWEYGSEFDIKPGNPRFRSPKLAMRDEQWKLLINPDGKGVELYNLEQDHAETINVAEHHKNLVRAMSNKTLAWYTSVSKEQ